MSPSSEQVSAPPVVHVATTAPARGPVQARAVYPEIAEPPSLAGAAQVGVRVPPPRVTLVTVGAPGSTEVGVTGTRSDDVEVPERLLAVTST